MRSCQVAAICRVLGSVVEPAREPRPQLALATHPPAHAPLACAPPADPTRHSGDAHTGNGSTQQEQQQQQQQTAVELSDTDSADWQLPKGKPGSGGQQVATIGGGGADASGAPIYSSATVFAVRLPAGAAPPPLPQRLCTGAARLLPCRVPLPHMTTRHLPPPQQVRNGNGNYTKFYYTFHNVRLTKRGLWFYMPPGRRGAGLEDGLVGVAGLEGGRVCDALGAERRAAERWQSCCCCSPRMLGRQLSLPRLPAARPPRRHEAAGGALGRLCERQRDGAQAAHHDSDQGRGAAGKVVLPAGQVPGRARGVRRVDRQAHLLHASAVQVSSPPAWEGMCGRASGGGDARCVLRSGQRAGVGFRALPAVALMPLPAVMRTPLPSPPPPQRPTAHP